jgi:hypothetical protein
MNDDKKINFSILMPAEAPEWIRIAIQKLQPYALAETHIDLGGAFAMQKVKRKIKKFGFDWTHMLFDPINTNHTPKVIATKLFCKRFGLDARQYTKQYILPHAYYDFLRFSNGAHLFGGHLNLYGQENELSDFASSGNYKTSTLQCSNFMVRTPFLPDDMVEIGKYPYKYTTIAANGENIIVPGYYSSGKEKVWDSFDVFFNDEFDRLQKLMSVDGVIDNPEMVSPFYIKT